MSNNGMLDSIDIREAVATSFVQQLLSSSPDRQEKILRMLINRMSRAQRDMLFIAQQLYSEPPAHQLTDFLQKEHEQESETK
jgi:hypothetical protein